jgi:hypothetical protein
MVLEIEGKRRAHVGPAHSLRPKDFHIEVAHRLKARGADDDVSELDGTDAPIIDWQFPMHGVLLMTAA